MDEAELQLQGIPYAVFCCQQLNEYTHSVLKV